ncbi:MAG: TatD family hydrolase [Xanthomonadales bacterium]|nr:TatD family hydrolase [Xanthomonadales bacterium]
MSKKKRPIPVFEQPLIETHCHLDYLEQASTEEIVRRAREVGVERLITIGVEPANLGTVRRLIEDHPTVFGTQGVHPHQAGLFDEAAAAEIETHLGSEKIVAVGEIGLDYYYDNAPRAVQRTVFARQLDIAASHDLPVVIHTREAEADTAAILAEHAPRLARKGVIHSFTSSVALAEQCLELGFSLGFNGIVTFRNADNVREVVAATPPERILLETDSPYLTPVPYRGRENAPFYIPFVAEEVARVKDQDVEQLLATAYRNSLALFWPGEQAA